MHARPGVAFGQLVQRLRLAAGLTQQDLADRSGLSVRGISDLERGLKSRPRPQTIRMLADGLDLDPDDRVALFHAAVQRPQGLEPVLAWVSPRVSARPRLPKPADSLIGRETETARIARLLGDPVQRLVTITGPSGVGKTRLALEAATAAFSEYRDGVAWAAMAAIHDPDLVPNEIAFAFGLRALQGDDLVGALAGALQGQQALLVMDNIHRSLNAGRRLARMLDLVPGLKILATSQARLGVSVESVVEVLPLDLNGHDAEGDPAVIADHPGVRLYLERANGGASYPPMASNRLAAAAEIVRGARGLPLAIELAAAQTRLMSSEALATYLEKTNGAESSKTGIPAVASSVGMLSENERRFLRWLTVFRGGFTLEAAHAVVADPGASPGRTLDLVSSLVNHRLVDRTPGPGVIRHDLPVTVFEQVRIQLIEAGEHALARGRHLTWAISFSHRTRERVFYPPAPGDAGPELFDADFDNMRAALEWAAASGNAIAGMQLIGGLWFQFSTRGLQRAGLDWARRFAPLPLPPDTALPPMGLIGASWLAALAGAGVEGETYGRLGLARAGEVEPDLEPLAMMMISLSLSAQHRITEALATAEAALELAIQPPGSRWLGLVLNRLGVSRANNGDFFGAITPIEHALAVWRRNGFPWGMATAKRNLANYLYHTGEWARVIALHQEVIHETTHQSGLWTVLHAWLGLAEIALAMGDHRRAALLLGVGERFRDANSLILPREDWEFWAATERELRSEAGARLVAAWLAEGKALTPDEAFQIAGEVGEQSGVDVDPEEPPGTS